MRYFCQIFYQYLLKVIITNTTDNITSWEERDIERRYMDASERGSCVYAEVRRNI